MPSSDRQARSAAQTCANCGAPKAAGLCTNVMCQNHNGPSAAYDRSKVEEGDRRIVEDMLKHTRPVESAARSRS